MATYEKKKWEESDNLKKQQQVLEAYKATKPGEYSSPNQQLSADALSKWQNYKPFNFDINRDALYNQYKNNYMTQGKLAMQDTMGQAAALTGGYGSSYAQNVGQQAYQGYLQKLNDVVPTLQEAAYNRYLQGKNDAYNNWQALQAMESQDYSRYMDKLNQYNAEYDRLYNEYNNAYNREYSQYQYDDQRAYQEYQDALSQENWQKQYDADQAYRNWQMAMAEKEYALSASKARASSTPTVTTAYDNGSLTTEEVKEIQRHLGIPETGYWDEITYRAAGEKTADWAKEKLDRDFQGRWKGDTSYINNYLSQTPTGNVNTAYQYAQGMYEPATVTLSDSEKERVKELAGKNGSDMAEIYALRLANKENLSNDDLDWLLSFFPDLIK